jgi:hypothetical protein
LSFLSGSFLHKKIVSTQRQWAFALSEPHRAGENGSLQACSTQKKRLRKKKKRKKET